MNKILIACPRYVRAGNLTYLKKLIAHYDKTTDREFYFLVNEGNRRDLSFLKSKNVYFYNGNILFEGIFTKRLIKRLDIELVHFTSTLVPLFFRVNIKVVCTIHDLNFLTLTQGKVKDLYKRMLYKYSSKVSDGVVFISDFTKHVYTDFVTHVPESIVIYEASESRLEINKRIVKSNELICFAHRKHKNAEAAIKVCSQLACDFKLHVIGLNETVKKLADDLGISNRVQFHHLISDDELDRLYSLSKCLIFLSSYEGFGLPILEAYERECLVITHQLCSLPEVAGKDAFYITDDKHGYSEAAKYIEKIFINDSFFYSEVKKNNQQKEKFSWEKTANKTLGFYDKLTSEAGT